MLKTCLHLFLIIIIGFIIYQNILNTPFYYDDNHNIVENYKLRDLNNLWPPSGSRWFGFLTFAINYYIGGLNTFGYHIFNLAVHVINAILVYWLVVLTFKTAFLSKQYAVSSMQTKEESKPNSTYCLVHSAYSWFIALFSALLFVSHPIQTQAVTYIVQRLTSLTTLFYLMSLVMYVKFRMQGLEFKIQDSKFKINNNSESKNLKSSIPNPKSQIFNLKSVFWYLVSIISTVLAMKTKEIAFTLPIVIVLYEFCFFTTSPNSQAKACGYKSNPQSSISNHQSSIPNPPLSPLSPLNNKWGIKGGGIFTCYALRLLYLLPFLLTMLIIPLSMLGVDKPIGELLSDVSEATRVQTTMSRLDYLFTQFRVIVTYIRLLFLPINQNLDYDYPTYNSFLNPEVFLSFLSLASIFGLGVYLLSKSKQYAVSSKQNSAYSLLLTPYLRLISFGILWFFITLSVESSVIPIVDVIFEHRLYLPSVGAVIAFTSAIFYIFSRLTPHASHLTSYVFLSLLATVVIAFSGATYTRNKVWSDDISLWEDVIRKSPMKVAGYSNIGIACVKRGWIDKAIEYFEVTLKGVPDDAEIHSDIGAAYGAKGLTDKAIEHLETALKLKPDLTGAHNNLGIVYKSKGLIDKSIEHFHAAIRLNPYSAETHSNLGNAYYKKGRLDDAIREYQIALSLKPDDIETQYNLSLVYSIKNAIDSNKK